VLSSKQNFRRSTVPVGVLVAALCIGFAMTRRVTSYFASSTQDSVPGNCVDAQGRRMTNDDGSIQLRCIDRNAQIAENGNALAIRNLTETVIEFSQVGRVTDAFLEPFKERIVRAELAFRAGSRNGIKEEDIVRAINNVETKLGAPLFARAYIDEVKFLREDLRASIPHLIKNKDTEISPIESVYLLDLLAYQKMINEKFLLTEEERKMTPSKVAVQTRGSVSPKLIETHPRVTEMLNFVDAAAKRPPSELLEVAQRLMDDLSMGK
jgi:hypothetical protein